MQWHKKTYWLSPFHSQTINWEQFEENWTFRLAVNVDESLLGVAFFNIHYYQMQRFVSFRLIIPSFQSTNISPIPITKIIYCFFFLPRKIVTIRSLGLFGGCRGCITSRCCASSLWWIDSTGTSLRRWIVWKI